MNNDNKINYTGNLSALLRAPEALKNWKAFAILAVTCLAVGVTVSFAGYLFNAFDTQYIGPIFGGIVMLLAPLIGASGFSGAGILLMDQARNIEVRSLMDAFISGLMSVIRLVLVFLLDIVAVLAFTLIVLLLLLICKIPGVGPVLYTVVFPLLVLVSGGLFAALFFVIMPMTLPAIWEGNSIKDIYVRRWALVENRLVQIVIGLILLLLIVGLIAALVNTVMFSGFMFTSGLSASVLNFDSDLSYMLSRVMRMATGGGAQGGGYLTAAMIGGGLLLLVAMSIPFLVYIFGINLIYLGAMNGLNISAAEQKISQGMEGVKRGVEEMKARAAEASKRAREASSKRAQAQPAMACPGCGVAITTDDVLCAGCGKKLK